jgi:excinuclease UvrABC nuclease subunit
VQEGYIRPFNEDNVRNIPSGFQGIYAIYDATAADSLVCYLGRSVDVRDRLTAHLRGYRNASSTIKMLLSMGHELWFSYSSSSNYKGAEAAEIKRLLPTGNKRLETKQLEDF